LSQFIKCLYGQIYESSQFPIEQQYEPGGDWNQGMLSVGLKAGSQFTLLAKWDVKGKPYQAKLQGISCAK